MKRCITTHDNPRFGEIPAGSLWADDSPYLGAGEFEDIETPVEFKAERPVVRKFGTKKAPQVVEPEVVEVADVSAEEN